MNPTENRNAPSLRSVWPRLSWRGKVWVAVAALCIASWGGFVGFVLWVLGGGS